MSQAKHQPQMELFNPNEHFQDSQQLSNTTVPQLRRTLMANPSASSVSARDSPFSWENQMLHPSHASLVLKDIDCSIFDYEQNDPFCKTFASADNKGKERSASHHDSQLATAVTEIPENQQDMMSHLTFPGSMSRQLKANGSQQKLAPCVKSATGLLIGSSNIGSDPSQTTEINSSFAQDQSFSAQQELGMDVFLGKLREPDGKNERSTECSSFWPHTFSCQSVPQAPFIKGQKNVVENLFGKTEQHMNDASQTPMQKQYEELAAMTFQLQMRQQQIDILLMQERMKLQDILLKQQFHELTNKGVKDQGASNQEDAQAQQGLHKGLRAAAKSGGRKRQKKDINKPKRPLTAYNIFFKDERAVMLGLNDSCVPEGADFLEQQEEVKIRKRVGFAEMAQRISQTWKQLDKEGVAKYKARAAQDKQRYTLEKAAYMEANKEKDRKDS